MILLKTYILFFSDLSCLTIIYFLLSEGVGRRGWMVRLKDFFYQFGNKKNDKTIDGDIKRYFMFKNFVINQFINFSSQSYSLIVINLNV